MSAREVRLIVPIQVLRSELLLAKIIEGTECVKSEKTIDLLVMWVDSQESMIQDEGDELAKQEIPECAKVTVHGCAKLVKVFKMCVVDDPALPVK